jgi:hypothetical protein
MAGMKKVTAFLLVAAFVSGCMKMSLPAKKG